MNVQPLAWGILCRDGDLHVFNPVKEGLRLVVKEARAAPVVARVFDQYGCGPHIAVPLVIAKEATA